jgi:hypothetical protein
LRVTSTKGSSQVVEIDQALERVVGQVGLYGRNNGQLAVCRVQQRVAIRLGPRGCVNAERSAAAAAIVDHDRNGQDLAHPLGEQAPDQISVPARGIWDDDLYRTGWIGLR